MNPHLPTSESSPPVSHDWRHETPARRPPAVVAEWLSDVWAVIAVAAGIVVPVAALIRLLTARDAGWVEVLAMLGSFVVGPLVWRMVHRGFARRAMELRATPAGLEMHEMWAGRVRGTPSLLPWEDVDGVAVATGFDGATASVRVVSRNAFAPPAASRGPAAGDLDAFAEAARAYLGDRRERTRALSAEATRHERAWDRHFAAGLVIAAAGHLLVTGIRLLSEPVGNVLHTLCFIAAALVAAVANLVRVLRRDARREALHGVHPPAVESVEREACVESPSGPASLVVPVTESPAR